MTESLSYKNAGVDTERAHAMVGDIGKICARTQTHRKLHQAFGLFAAAYDLSAYTNPVILAACDGVGTKLLLQLEYGELESAGVDLVAMNVNDILTSNAQPLMFLDYIGIHHLDEELISRLITGMADSLAACDCILAGGETAEMPDMVHEGLVELSGFCIGAAERDELLDPSTIAPGDQVIGVPSSGFHANGWSLIRKIIERDPATFDEARVRRLLAPTRIYHPEVEALKASMVGVKGMAHITGGGIRENLERILGEHGASLTLPKWANEDAQAVVDAIDLDDAIHALNMGIGWMVVVPPDQVDAALAALPDATLLGPVDGQDITVQVSS
jgi:phosphoribosylformylglycinamidine cyclo-ligase